MPPDLEPTSALAERIETECVEDYGAESGQGSCCGFRRVLAEQLIESDRASVREPLEKRNRELETLVCDEREVILQQRKALDGLETDLTQIRDYLPTDWTNETVRGGEAMLVVKKKWDECRRQDERIASLEAQLASAPRWIPVEERKPERGQICHVVYRGVVQYMAYMWRGEFWQACIDEFDSADADAFSHWAPSSPPPAQKEPHGR